MITSVLIAAYNAEATLGQSVESALGQTLADLEVIVVDDGSDTPVADVLAAIHDPRLRLIRHQRNRGVSAARNTALAVARAPLVSQLDADDLWKPSYLEQIVACFDDPRVGLAYSNTTIIGHPDGLTDYIGDASIHPLDTFPRFAEANPIPSPTATMRTSAVRNIGGYATWLLGVEDYHLYAKLVLAGWRFAYVDRELAGYRWPTAERGKSYNRRRQQLAELQMWVGFAARHPLTPGPRHQACLRLGDELRRPASLWRPRRSLHLRQTVKPPPRASEIVADASLVPESRGRARAI